MPRVTMDPNQTPESYYEQYKQYAKNYPKDAVFMQGIRQIADGYKAVNLTWTKEKVIAALQHTATLRSGIQQLHDAGLFNHKTYEAVLELIKIQDIMLILQQEQQELGSN